MVTAVVMFRESKEHNYHQLNKLIPKKHPDLQVHDNLKCQSSNSVVISHLKQFIGCSSTIIQQCQACFMDNQSCCKQQQPWIPRIQLTQTRPDTREPRQPQENTIGSN